MPAHCIEVYQLRARDGQAFLNVDCKNYSGIGVWGNTYGLCTVLYRKDSYFHLMQFEAKAFSLISQRLPNISFAI